MSLNNPVPGANHAAEYLVPGVPWVTSSTVAAGAVKAHELPAVCSSIHARCVSGSAGALLLGFTTQGVTGSGTNRVSIAPGTSADFRVRSKTIVVGGLSGVASYELLVGLTTIPAKNFEKYVKTADSVLEAV